MKQFLGTFVFTLVLILLISIVFDISEKIDDFYQRQAPIDAIISDYYLNFVVHYGLLFSSLFTFLAVIISTSKLANNSEIIAILNSGMNVKRLLRPYFIGAAIIATVTFFCDNWILPKTNQVRLDFEQQYLRKKKDERYKNIHRQISPEHYIFMESYNGKKQKGFRFSYEIFDQQQLISKFQSDFITWDTLEGKWLAESYSFRTIKEKGEKLEKGSKIYKDFGFAPEELVYKTNSTSLMTFPNLIKFIEKEKIRGAENIHFFEIEKHHRAAAPITTFVLTLIGFAVAIHKRRGGIGVNLVYGFVLTTLFILFQKVAITFATNSNLTPFMAAWLPNIVFGLYAYHLYRKANR